MRIIRAMTPRRMAERSGAHKTPSLTWVRGNCGHKKSPTLRRGSLWLLPASDLCQMIRQVKAYLRPDGVIARDKRDCVSLACLSGQCVTFCIGVDCQSKHCNRCITAITYYKHSIFLLVDLREVGGAACAAPARLLLGFLRVERCYVEIIIRVDCILHFLFAWQAKIQAKSTLAIYAFALFYRAVNWRVYD